MTSSERTGAAPRATEYAANVHLIRTRARSHAAQRDRLREYAVEPGPPDLKRSFVAAATLEFRMLEDPTETRRCLSCDNVSAELDGVTDYALDVRVAATPVGDVDHGSVRQYRCSSCDASFKLLDPYRRMWMYYGLALGVAAAAFGIWMGTSGADGIAVALVAAVAILFSATTLVMDGRARRRSAPPT